MHKYNNTKVIIHQIFTKCLSMNIIKLSINKNYENRFSTFLTLCKK